MHIGKIETRRDTDCPVCGRAAKKMLDLPRYPLTEIYEPYDAARFDNTGFVDQGLLFCEDCSHGKLETIISPAFLYSSNYRTSTAGSIGSMNAIRNFRAFIDDGADVGAFDTIVDIGANDATMLMSFGDRKRRLVAIDPNTDKKLEAELGVEVIADYVENVQLDRGPGRTLFICSHTLEHIERPASMLGALKGWLGPDDVCVFQFPSLDLLVRDARFDQVHHQHVNYFSERSISTLLVKLGYEVLGTRFDPDHYGTLMIMFRLAAGGAAPVGSAITGDFFRERLKVFHQDVAAANLRIERHPAPLLAFGAGLMLPLVAYNLPALERVECVVDDDTTKTGLRFVNFNKEIVHSSSVEFAGKDAVVTALATKLALRKILVKLFELKVTNIIVPLHQL